MYYIQQVDKGYQIFRKTTIQEYPPEIVSSPAEEETIYLSREEALGRLQELSKGIKQRLGRIVEITIRCGNVEEEQTIRAACTELVEPLQEMLEFLTFTEEPQQGEVQFLMRLFDHLSHSDADQPLRNLLSQFLEFDGVTKGRFSFWVIEFAE